MTTNQVLQLDCRKAENQKIMQKVLKQIKPLSKYSDEEEIPFWAIEKAICVMTKKYEMHITNIYPDIYCNDECIVWKASLCDDKTLKMMALVYGADIYELFSKCAVKMYAEVKKGVDKR